MLFAVTKPHHLCAFKIPNSLCLLFAVKVPLFNKFLKVQMLEARFNLNFDNSSGNLALVPSLLPHNSSKNPALVFSLLPDDFSWNTGLFFSVLPDD